MNDRWTNMDWSCNILVVEKILCNVDLPDLLSAATVSKAWLTASAKAFGATSRVVIPDTRPDDVPNLALLLERFKRIKDFKFKLATSNGLNCILADLPLEKLTAITHLTLDYAPTAKVLKAINSFLDQLTSRFPTLKQLQICPNADPAEDLVLPLFEFSLDNVVSFAEHPNLTVLRVPIGPNSGSGIDWRFLASLKKLKRLCLLKFHIRGGGQYVHRQLDEFMQNFPEDVRISELEIHLRLGIRKTWLRWDPDLNALDSAFKSINTETCTLYIEQVESDDKFHPWLHICQYWSVASLVVRPTLKRINVHYSMPLFTPERLTQLAFALLSPLRHYQNHTEHKSSVLLRLDICSEEASPPKTFIELECARPKAPLIIRHGPIGNYTESFQNFSNTCLETWTFNNPMNISRPATFVPHYNALRKYTFDRNQEIIAQEQFYAATYPNRPEVLIYEGSHRVWRNTEFRSFPHSASIVSAQSSWKLPQMSTTEKVPVLPVTVVLVYSID